MHSPDLAPTTTRFGTYASRSGSNSAPELHSPSSTISVTCGLRFNEAVVYHNTVHGVRFFPSELLALWSQRALVRSSRYASDTSSALRTSLSGRAHRSQRQLITARFTHIHSSAVLSVRRCRARFSASGAAVYHLLHHWPRDHGRLQLFHWPCDTQRVTPVRQARGCGHSRRPLALRFAHRSVRPASARVV